MKILVLLTLFVFISNCQQNSQNDNNTSEIKTDSVNKESKISSPKIDESNYVHEDIIFPSSPFEGYFVKYEVGDYVHAIFMLLDSTEVSLWMPNNSTIEKKLNNNKASLFKVYYKIHTDFIPEAEDSVQMEIIKSIEIIE